MNSGNMRIVQVQNFDANNRKMVQYASKKKYSKTFGSVLYNGIYHVVWLPFLTVVLFGFKAVSFRFVSFHVVPLMPNATAGKSRIARQRRTLVSDRACEKWVGSGR